MSIVGAKDIFAIEWEFFPDFQMSEFKFWGMYFRYWGNSVPIGIWEDFAHIEPVIRHTEAFLQDPNIRSCIDFSALSKIDVYQCVHASYIENEYPEKYHDIYRVCCEKMVERIGFEAKLQPEQRVTYAGSSFFIDDVEHYLRYQAMQTDDILLARWLGCNFEISQLGEDSFNHQSIYLVRDIAKERERLIWKYHDLSQYEELTEQKLMMPHNYLNQVYEAVMPIGYFDEIAREFIRLANEEIDLMRKDKFVPSVNRENWERKLL